jgi:hypothetical protein
MEHRVDLYRNVHKGIRRMLAQLVDEAGALDPSSPTEVAALAQRFRGAARVLEAHHVHEEKFIGPHLERAAPPLFARMERDHEALGHDLERLQASAVSAHSFYLDLASYVGRYFTHIDQEERVFNVALQAAFSDAELLAIEQALVASIAPELMGEFLTMVLPALNAAERDELFAGLTAGAPAPVIDGLFHLAGVVLPARESARLRARFGQARAG